MKKFYTLVSVSPLQEGFGISLDNRPVKTPSGQVLAAPTQALAEAIQGEWAAQGDFIIPDSMPITQLLNTAQDQVASGRASMSASVLKYLDTDLLCYHAGAHPPGQAEAQKAAWQPWLDWFENKYGVNLETTEGLAALSQPATAHEKAKSFVEALSDHQFTVLQIVVPLTGSLVLGMAFVDGAISPQDTFDAAHVEENFKADLYNEDFYGADPAQEKKQLDKKRDLEACAVYLELIAS